MPSSAVRERRQRADEFRGVLALRGLDDPDGVAQRRSRRIIGPDAGEPAPEGFEFLPVAQAACAVAALDRAQDVAPRAHSVLGAAHMDEGVGVLFEERDLFLGEESLLAAHQRDRQLVPGYGEVVALSGVVGGRKAGLRAREPRTGQASRLLDQFDDPQVTRFRTRVVLVEILREREVHQRHLQ